MPTMNLLSVETAKAKIVLKVVSSLASYPILDCSHPRFVLLKVGSVDAITKNIILPVLSFNIFPSFIVSADELLSAMSLGARIQINVNPDYSENNKVWTNHTLEFIRI